MRQRGGLTSQCPCITGQYDAGTFRRDCLAIVLSTRSLHVHLAEQAVDEEEICRMSIIKAGAPGKHGASFPAQLEILIITQPRIKSPLTRAGSALLDRRLSL